MSLPIPPVKFSGTSVPFAAATPPIRLEARVAEARQGKEASTHQAKKKPCHDEVPDEGQGVPMPPQPRGPSRHALPGPGLEADAPAPAMTLRGIALQPAPSMGEPVGQGDAGRGTPLALAGSRAVVAGASKVAGPAADPVPAPAAPVMRSDPLRQGIASPASGAEATAFIPVDEPASGAHPAAVPAHATVAPPRVLQPVVMRSTGDGHPSDLRAQPGGDDPLSSVTVPVGVTSLRGEHTAPPAGASPREAQAPLNARRSLIEQPAPAQPREVTVTVPFTSWGQGHQVTAHWAPGAGPEAAPAGQHITLRGSSPAVIQAMDTALAAEGQPSEGLWQVDRTDGDNPRDQRRAPARRPSEEEP